MKNESEIQKEDKQRELSQAFLERWLETAERECEKLEAVADEPDPGNNWKEEWKADFNVFKKAFQTFHQNFQKSKSLLFWEKDKWVNDFFKAVDALKRWEQPEVYFGIDSLISEMTNFFCATGYFLNNFYFRTYSNGARVFELDDKQPEQFEQLLACEKAGVFGAMQKLANDSTASEENKKLAKDILKLKDWAVLIPPRFPYKKNGEKAKLDGYNTIWEGNVFNPWDVCCAKIAEAARRGLCKLPDVVKKVNEEVQKTPSRKKILFYSERNGDLFALGVGNNMPLMQKIDAKALKEPVKKHVDSVAQTVENARNNFEDACEKSRLNSGKSDDFPADFLNTDEFPEETPAMNLGEALRTHSLSLNVNPFIQKKAEKLEKFLENGREMGTVQYVNDNQLDDKTWAALKQRVSENVESSLPSYDARSAQYLSNVPMNNSHGTIPLKRKL